MRNLSNGVGMMDGGRAAAIPVDLAPAGGIGPAVLPLFGPPIAWR